MRILRYTVLLLVFLVGADVWGQYNPSNPTEPGASPWKLTLQSIPTDAGSFNRDKVTSWAAGTKVSVTAKNNGNYKFQRWEYEDGTIASESASFSIVMPSANTVLVARYNYEPSSPTEPSAPVKYATVNIGVSPSDGGYTSPAGANKYAVGSKVTIYAYNYSNFTFVNWTEDGNVVATSSTLSNYEVKEGDVKLVANFKYAPGSPGEPEVAVVSHPLYLKSNPDGACSFNFDSGTHYKEGTSVNVSAYANTYYIFKNWTLDGEVISSSSNFSFQMPKRAATLVANFNYNYNPNNPNEPGVASTERHHLYGMHEDGVPGQTVKYPVYLENTSSLTGFSIDVSFPAGLAVDANNATLTERTSGHTLEVQDLGENSFRFFVRGSDPIAGANGKVLEIPLTIPVTEEVGTTYTIGLSKGAIFKADGSQSIVTVRSGSLKIQQSSDAIPDSPDFIISDIHVNESETGPGEMIHLSWKVNNAGQLEAAAGWSERIYLVSSKGKKVSIGTTYYDTASMAAGSSVSREVDIALGKLLGIEGETYVSITIVPNAAAGEIVERQDNNTTDEKGNILFVKKQLYLSVPTTALKEGETTTVRCQLARSGNWTSTEVFDLSVANGDTRLKVPATISIPKEQSSVYFYLTVENNDQLDESTQFTIQATGNGYSAVTGEMEIEDDELPSLTVTTSKSEVMEGDELELTVTIPRVSSKDVIVNLVTEYPKRFTMPSHITIPAGQTSANASIRVVDDDIPSIRLSNAFTVSADGYIGGESIVILNDDDIPALELTLTPNRVSESSGITSVAGLLRRTGKADNKITVKLTDDAGGKLYFGNRSLELAKGVEEIHFNFGPVDNAQVDGDRTYTITAAVWVSSCSCSASGESAGNVSAKLEVFDDDGASLSLTSSLSTVKEGGQTTLTISRNTATDNALTLSLSSDYDDNLTYDHTVVIPAGQSSVSVPVTSKPNGISGDSHTVIFTVSADGYSSGTCYLMVTDQTMPDARISSLTADKDEAIVGDELKLTVVVTNDGVVVLPSEVSVKIYRRGESTAVATLYTSEAIAVGASQTLTRTIVLPTTVGTQNYHAVVNEAHQVNELSYTNNTSAEVSIQTVSPFTVTVQTDKNIYIQGDKVLITGQLTGNGTADTDIDLYVINEGAREVRTVKTDAQGTFVYEWELYALQSGHFSVGACYPGEGVSAEMASFDVYGLKRTSNGYITCDVINGDTYTGNIGLTNPGNLGLTGVRVELLSAPSNCVASFNVPSVIPGGEAVQLSYSLQGTAPSSEEKWDEVKARVITAEGVSLDLTLYFYCRTATGKLVASTKAINTTMIKGKSREYSIQVTNTGRGNTGNITLALPDFIRSLAGNTLPSLDQNDTLTIALGFTPKETMQLNVPVTGQLGINCDNGDGTYVSFSITPVSEETGTLVVDVCDEYTYYTNEAPHVAGAEVVVRNPVTNALVTQGVTGNDGIFSVVLPEGYYKVNVTANNHDSYTNNIFVDPGTETRQIINLSTQAITVNWKVEETEVEDEYEIVTTVKYETNVPTPVVELIVPEKLDVESLSEGESIIFTAVLTNKGLITAHDAEFILPEGFTHLLFEPLAEYTGLTIAPQQSIFIPVKVTRNSGTQVRASARNLDNDPCVGYPGTLYFWDCGEDRKWHRYGIAMQLGSCRSDDPSTWGGGGGGFAGGGGPGGLGGPGFGAATTNFYGSGSNSNNVSTSQDEGCEPCQNRFLYKMTKCITGRIPVFKWVWEIVDWISDPADKVQGEIQDRALDRLEDMSNKLKPVWKRVKKFLGFLDVWGDCVRPLYEPCDPGEFNNSRAFAKTRSRNYPSYIDEYLSELDTFTSAVNASIDQTLEWFGDSIWLYADEVELSTFVDNFYRYALNEIDETVLKSYKPGNIPMDKYNLFIERWNNTINGVESSNKIDIDKYDDYDIVISDVKKSAEDKGYSSPVECYEAAENAVMERLENASNSVCATITLQIKQTMVMTRQAFRGTLTVFNGHETTPMTDVKLTLNVSSEYGTVATAHEFQINAESLDGFTGNLNLTDGWTLAANGTGTATILFIPTKYAAPTEPVKYAFGGTLSYVDPYTGLEVTRELFPVTLTVKPSPELDLTYFMQRDIYGDDALTLDVVEPMVPAEFALLINNKGNGDATNVRMVTQQPEIIDNEKGLYIDFEIIRSQVNGGEANLAFGKSIANDFGTIPAHSQSYAQWWLTSTLLGHFTEYDVQANHVTSYGNEDLSLLGDVTIHEMIRSLDLSANGNKMVGFLVNDITDTEDMPDMLYLSNGETATVSIASNCQMSKTSITTYNLTITPSTTGWTYGNIKDPTQGLATLKSIVRQRDGKEINLRNFWQTDRTLRDGKDPLYEYRIHFADEFTGTTPETYILTFDPTPDMVLSVSSITTIPEEGNIAEEPIDELTVTFNKKIDASTFTGEDITFAVQGVKQDASQIGIATTDNQTFTLDMSEINPSLSNGYYTLTVQTNDITDNEGFQGKNGKQVGWILFRGGLVQLLTSAYPENSGTVKRKPSATADARGMAPVSEEDVNTARYGSTVTLVAEPATGYEFANWTLNGEVVSTDAEFEAKALGDMDIVANFTKKKYMVNVNVEGTGGTTEGTATGIYEYGTELNVIAVPDEDFMLKGWSVNGKAVEGSGNKLTVTANDALDIDVTFMQEFYRQSLTLAKGWNWISAYLYEPLNITEMSRYANRIISQTGELINDPEFGLVGNITEMTAGQAYKIEANSRFTNSFRGHLYDVIAQPINLRKGWNWIPFPFKEKAPIDALTSAEEGDYITSQTGFAEFADGTWEGTLNMFTPGNGYLYKSVTGKNLTFDTSMSISSSRAWVARRTDVTEQDIDVHRYPNTMNVTARIYQDGKELQGDVYCIYAVVGDELRGISQYISGNHYLTVYGDEPVDITFLVESTETAETFLANEVLTFRNDVVGSRKSPFAITINNATGINSFDNSKTMTVYTVEGVLISRDATLKTLRRLPKGIYIVNGQKRYVK